MSYTSRYMRKCCCTVCATLGRIVTLPWRWWCRLAVDRRCSRGASSHLCDADAGRQPQGAAGATRRHAAAGAPAGGGAGIAPSASLSPRSREFLRLRVNARERQRMHDMNLALDALRRAMPYAQVLQLLGLVLWHFSAFISSVFCVSLVIQLTVFNLQSFCAS